MSNWPISDERLEAVKNEFQIVWNEVGESRFERAVGKIVQESDRQFFPTVGEFRSFIPVAPRGGFWRDPNCPDCHGTGFKEVTTLVKRPDGTWQNREVARCRREGCLRVA